MFHLNVYMFHLMKQDICYQLSFMFEKEKTKTVCNVMIISDILNFISQPCFYHFSSNVN